MAIKIQHKGEIVATVTFVVNGMGALKINMKKKKNRPSRRLPQPGWRRAGLLKPMYSVTTTPGRQLISCGTSLDFLIALNIDRNCFLDILHPKFETATPWVNYGSPCRQEPKSCDRNCIVKMLT